MVGFNIRYYNLIIFFPEKLIKILDNQTVNYDKQMNNIFWINEINDYLSFKKNKSKKYGYWKYYLKRNIKVFFDWKDPLPFFAELFSLIKINDKIYNFL